MAWWPHSRPDSRWANVFSLHCWQLQLPLVTSCSVVVGWMEEIWVVLGKKVKWEWLKSINDSNRRLSGTPLSYSSCLWILSIITNEKKLIHCFDTSMNFSIESVKLFVKSTQKAVSKLRVTLTLLKLRRLYRLRPKWDSTIEHVVATKQLTLAMYC